MQVRLMTDQGAVGKGGVVGTQDAAGSRRSIQAAVQGVGTVGATVKIYGMNDARFPVEIMEFVLTGTNMAVDAERDDFPWEYYQAEVVAINGVGAQVSVSASV